MSDYFDLEKTKDTCLILHDAVTPLTALLVSEIKMAAQIPWSKVSDVLQGFIALRLGQCLIKVRIHCLLYLNLARFYEIIMRFSSNCAIGCDLRSIVWNRTIANIRWPVHFKVDNITWNQPQNDNKPKHSGRSQISLVNSNMKFVKVKNLF